MLLDNALYADLSAFADADDVAGLRALFAARGDAIAQQPRSALRAGILAAMRHGAFASLAVILDEVVAPDDDVGEALEYIADLDFPNAKVVSDAWVANVMRTVAMFRERLPPDWDLRPARRLARELHAWAVWIALEPPNPHWLAIFLDAVSDKFWTDPTPHDLYWFDFFARRADDDALADRILGARARPALRALLEGEADRRRRERAGAFALGSVRRLMPAHCGAARDLFAHADLVDLIGRLVVVAEPSTP